MTRNEYFQKVGEYFGYPQCCINDFLNRVNTMTPVNWAQGEASNNTGFVPCKLHAQEVVEGAYTLESIITNRTSKSPFPKDDSPEDVRYINSLKS